MSIKAVIGGGVAMYVAQFIVSMATTPLIHNGVLADDYRANAEFWRPELNEVPPDMAALLPLWITTGIVGALVLAAVYVAVRGAFSGPGWQRGAKFGFAAWVIQTVTMAGWSGVFDLPYGIWLWWAAEGTLYMVIGGLALGLVADRLSPPAQAHAAA